MKCNFIMSSLLFSWNVVRHVIFDISDDRRQMFFSFTYDMLCNETQ